MGTIKIETNNHLAIVRFNNGVSNAVGSDFVNDLSDALKTTAREFSGQLLAGGDKFFSIGLNLPELLTLNRPDMKDFLYRFNQLVFDIYAHPPPTAAAIKGHAPAAGTIFAMASDFRVAAEGRKLIGLNEIQLGIPVPYLAVLILNQIVPHWEALSLLYSGRLIEPAQAKAIGLIDDVVAFEKVEAFALEKINEIAMLPEYAFRAIKNSRVEGIRAKFEEHHKAQHEVFLDCWFKESTRALLLKAAEKF